MARLFKLIMSTLLIKYDNKSLNVATQLTNNEKGKTNMAPFIGIFENQTSMQIAKTCG
jgi:hypothetical protein